MEIGSSENISTTPTIPLGPITPSIPTIKELLEKVAKYELRNKIQAKRIHTLQMQNRRFRNTIKKYSVGDVPNSWKNNVVREKLKSKLSKSKIEMLLSKAPRKFSKFYSNLDHKQTLQLRMIGGPKAVEYVKKEIINIPSVRTNQRLIDHIMIKPDVIIEPVIDFLKHSKQNWTSTEHLAVIMFDEVNLMSKCELNLKTGNVIGKLDRE